MRPEPHRSRARRRVAIASRVAVVLVVAVLGVAGIPDQGTPAQLHANRIAVADGAYGIGKAADVATGMTSNMAGFSWQGTDSATIEVRALRNGTWGGWTQVRGDPDEGPDANSVEHRSNTISADPLWLGDGVQNIQVRVADGAVHGLNVTAIDSQNARPSTNPFAAKPAAARVAAPFINTRADWGADESYRSINEGCGTPVYASNVRRGIVHHTVDSNDYAPQDVPAIIRGIYYFHTHTNGWCDIGYNFLVDRYGGIWEGRYGGIYSSVVGAHTSGFNTGSTGISVIGNFDIAPVPGAAYAALRQIMAFKLSYHGVDPAGQSWVTVGDNTGAYWPAGTVILADNIDGHRDFNSTACPGQYLYALLPQLRADVAQMVAADRDKPVICDWNGNGVDAPANFLHGQWYIRFSETTGPAEAVFPYGNDGDIPVCGDWDGNGTETPGVYRNGVFYLRNSVSPGFADVVIAYGNPGDIPIVGDWNGDGRTDIGVFRNGTWFLRAFPLGLPTAVSDNSFVFGDPGDQPVAGHWNGIGTDLPGVFRGGTWYERNSLSGGYADRAFAYGESYDNAIVGDWNNDFTDTPGVNRGAYWYLRNSNTTGAGDAFFGF